MKKFKKKSITTVDRSNLITPSFLYFMLPLIENTLYSYIIVGGFFFLIGKHLGSLEQLKQSSVNLWYFLAALGAIGIVYCLIEAWLLPPVSIEEPHPFVVLAHKITEAQIEELEKLLRFEYERKREQLWCARDLIIFQIRGGNVIAALGSAIEESIIQSIPTGYLYYRYVRDFLATILHAPLDRHARDFLNTLLNSGEERARLFDFFVDGVGGFYHSVVYFQIPIKFCFVLIHKEYTSVKELVEINNYLGLASYDFLHKAHNASTPDFYKLACTLLSKQPSQVTIIFANAPEVTANSSIPLGYILVFSIMLFFISSLIVSRKRGNLAKYF